MKKLNNKGFSLVELIIVIAIMAILVGVVGTQVIPYLENSRKAKDIQVLSAWNTAAMSAYSNAAAVVAADANYTIEITSTGLTVKEGSDATTQGAKSIKGYFTELTTVTNSGYAFSSMESKAGKAITKVTITITGSTGEMLLHADAGSYTFDDIESK